MLALLRNQKVRGIIFQLLTVIGLVAFLWYIGENTIHNIQQRGIRTGFDFLNTTDLPSMNLLYRIAKAILTGEFLK